MKANQSALLGHTAWAGKDEDWAAGLFLLQASHPWLSVCLWSNQHITYVPEMLTCWLPTELCAYAKGRSLPFLQTDVPSEWAA